MNSVSFDPPPEALADLEAMGIALSDEQFQQCSAYLARMFEANAQFNLSAIRDPKEAWDRHIVDSLSLACAGEVPYTLMDIGTGAGLPGLPLALLWPETQVTLVDATGKKCDFLQEVVDELDLNNVEVIQGRAEKLADYEEFREQSQVVTARAVAELRILVELALPLVMAGGYFLAPKGKKVQEEVADAVQAIEELGGGEISLHKPPGRDHWEGLIVRVDKESDTPKDYPRDYSAIKRKPL